MALADIRYRPGIVLGAAIALHLVAISLQATTRTGDTIFTGVVFGGFAELQRATGWLTGGVQSIWTEYIALRQVRAENVALRSEVGSLQVALQQERAAAERADAFRRLLEFKARTPLTMTGADVIGAGASPEFRTVTIDKGERDGVSPNMAVIAAAGQRVLEVFVPVDADPAVVARLKDLDARVTVCPREPGLPGDPTYHRLRQALAEGALPFTCQGNENGLAVESGFTLGYEMAEALAGGPPLDRLVIQVGGGALASACIEALGEAALLGSLARVPRYHAVQTVGASPLARAFELVAARLPAGAGLPEVRAALSYAATHRSEFMWPWEQEPRSIAHGILDDETYDWLAVVEGMLVSGGGPVVVSEDLLARANALALDATPIDVDPTGSSGLAGLLALRDQGAIGDHERVGVLLTGARR